MKKRFFIRLSYKGSNYHGWQIQPNALSVQECINKALGTILRLDINVVGCGRTDTGVHASDFFAHFDVTQDTVLDVAKLTFKLNRFLPKDIAIKSIFEVGEQAHARFDALSRTYHYYIMKVKNPFRIETHWKMTHELDVESMNVAAKILFDYHDFTSFSKLHTDVKTNNCKIYFAAWTETADEFIFTIKADRFLRNMVRAIVGTLVEVGRGKLDLNDFRKIIESKNRSNAGSSVPGHGLFLAEIEYPNTIKEVNS